MNKKWLLVGMVIGALLSYAVFPFGSLEGAPVALAQDYNGSDELPPEIIENQAADSEAPHEANETLVYFVPQDNDANGTVLLLYNTAAITNTVNIKTYTTDGVIFINTNVVVPPYSIRRVVSDTIAASPPA